jgi:hypothetical protein
VRNRRRNIQKTETEEEEAATTRFNSFIDGISPSV